MKWYSILHVPVLSFFSKALYRDVCFNWKGTGFAYLLLLLAICWIPPMIEVHVGLADFVDNEAQQIVSQVPTITITDGEASIDEPQPYYIREPETEKVIAIIDMTGGITSLADTEAKALLTRTQVVLEQNEVETRTYDLSQIEEFTLDQERINGWLATAKKYAVPALYPLALLISFVFRIVQVLLYAVVGLLFASLVKSRRGYGQLVRLAVVAVTPCIIIKTLLGIFDVTVPLASLWFFLLAMGYLFFGVRAAAQEEGPTGAFDSPQGSATGDADAGLP